MLYKCLYRRDSKHPDKLIEISVDVNSILHIVFNDQNYVEIITKESKVAGNIYALGTVDKVTEEINELKRLSRENW